MRKKKGAGMVRTMRWMVAVLSVALLWGSNASAVNIVSNGSFETFTGSFGADGGAQLNLGDTTLTDWEIINDEIAILEDPNIYNLTPSDGNNFLDLAGYTNNNTPSAPKGISQLLSGLTNGQKYVFTMDLGIRNGICVSGANNCTGPIEVSASIGTTVQTFTHNSADPGNIWKSFGFDFIADNTSLTLEILGLSLPSGNSFIGLDNVSVQAVDTAPGGGGTVPEPSALLLVGSGLVGIAVWRRKQTV